MPRHWLDVLIDDRRRPSFFEKLRNYFTEEDGGPPPEVPPAPSILKRLLKLLNDWEARQ